MKSPPVYQLKRDIFMLYKNEIGKNIDCRRSGVRFDVEQDIIIHHKGTKYPSKMKNISISGVIVSIPGLLPDTIQVGETCGLSFCADPTVKPEVYSSRVARVDPSGIALNFSGFIL